MPCALWTALTLWLAVPQALGEETPPPDPSGFPSLEWGFFADKGRAFQALKADPREAQFRMGFMDESERASILWDLGFGGDLGFLEARALDGPRISLTARGLMTARFDFGSASFDLLNADFIGGPALGYRGEANACEVFLYHQSSHLGDEVLEREERERIDYSREALRFLWARTMGPVRPYAGMSVNLRADPEEISGCLTPQMGAEVSFSPLRQPCYVAVDLQSKEENDWDVNLTAQAGVELGDPEKTSHRQRAFVEFFRGGSNMGQYYDERELYGMVGLAFNF